MRSISKDESEANNVADANANVMKSLAAKMDTFTLYLDNLRIRHADGSTSPIWMSGKDTRAGSFKANALFKELKVRAVYVAEAAK